MWVAIKNEAIANAATDKAIVAGKELSASYRKESFESAREAFEQGDLPTALSLLKVGYQREEVEPWFSASRNELHQSDRLVATYISD